jgi:signal transduction histidine kinase
MYFGRSRASLAASLNLRIRLIAFFVAIFGTTLLVFSTLLYQVFVTNHQKQFDDTLLNYAVDVAYSIDVDYFGELRLAPNSLRQNEKAFPFALGDTFLQLRTFTGANLARSKNLGRGTLPFTPSDRQGTVDRKAIFSTLSSHDATRMGLPGRQYRVIDYLIEKAGYGLILQVAAPMVLLEREKQGLITFFAFSIPFILIVAVLGGLYISSRALAPVNAIIEKTRNLSANRLSERVPVPEAHDEIRELAKTLNGLLNRLEQAFLSQENFIADASHQLKTPLAILQGELDLMRSRPRSPEENEQFFASASEEVRYLSRIIEELLLLARIDAGAASLQLREIRVDEIALDCIARIEKFAKKQSIKISLNLSEAGDDQSFVVLADPDLIRSLLETLLENAIKYSPATGGLVTLNLKNSEKSVELELKDQGEGILPEALPKIFQRFFRSERVPGEKPGAGLGLAIAKRIAEVHSGSIEAESVPGQGATFRVHLRKKWS